jgi:hypothetical protein
MQEWVKALQLLTQTVTEIVGAPLVLGGIAYAVGGGVVGTLVAALLGFAISMVVLIKKTK